MAKFRSTLQAGTNPGTGAITMDWQFDFYSNCEAYFPAIGYWSAINRTI